MAVSDNRVTFWFGCNMLRHAEMIRLSIMLLERAGYDVSAAGGPGYCCGTAHDHQPLGASNMASRTVNRFNEAAKNDGRGTVVTWCPSCHMHMSDIMAPGNAVAFDTSHISELLAASIDRLMPLLTVPVPRRVLLHRHLGFSNHVPINDRIASILRKIQGLEIFEGPAVPGHMCSGIAAVPGALKTVIGKTWAAAIADQVDTVCTIFHSCHREFAALDGRDNISGRNWVQLVAEAMGSRASDNYVRWRNGSAPEIASIERAGQSLYRKLIEPELRALPLRVITGGEVE